MKTMRFLQKALMAFSVLLMVAKYSQAQNCDAPTDMFVTTYSDGMYLYWTHDNSSVVAYDINYQYTDDVSQQTITGSLPTQVNDAIHSTYNYLVVKFPAGVGTTDLEVSIYPGKIPKCPSLPVPVIIWTGDIATDNIDVVTPACPAKIAGGEAPELTCEAHSLCVEISSDGTWQPSISPGPGSTSEARVSLKYDIAGGANKYLVKTTPTTMWYGCFTNIYHVVFLCGPGAAGGPGTQWHLTMDANNSNDSYCAEEGDEKNTPGTGSFLPHNLLVVPNPATSVVNIRNFNFAQAEALDVKLYNSLGQLVKSWNNIATESLDSYPFTIGELNSGVYFFELNAGNEVTRIKLIKSE